MSTETKLCTKCHLEKPLHEFCRDRSTATGRTSRCSACQREDWAAKQRPGRAHWRPWTDGEVAYLREHYGNSLTGEIAVTLGRPEKGIRIKAIKLGLRKPLLVWTPEEDHYLKQHFGKLPLTFVAATLKRSPSGTRFRAWKLGLAGQLKTTRAATITAGEKVCPRCKRVKPLAAFGLVQRPNANGAYNSWCKGCIRARWKELYATTKAYRDNAHENSFRRRARQAGAPLVERIYRKQIISREHSTCYLCGRVLSEKQCTLDHVIPLSRGGAHSMANIKVACASCNFRKHNKLLSELDWYKGPLVN